MKPCSEVEASLCKSGITSGGVQRLSEVKQQRLLGKWGSVCPPRVDCSHPPQQCCPDVKWPVCFEGGGGRLTLLTQLWGMGQAELPGIGAERCNPGHTPQQLHTCPMCSNRHSEFTFQFTFELRLWSKFIVGSYQKPTTQSSRNSRIEKNSTSTARRREGKEKRGRNKRNGSKRQARLY